MDSTLAPTGKSATMQCLFVCFLCLFLSVPLGAETPLVRSEPAETGFHPVIPQTWDGGVLQTLELPLADPKYSPVEVPWEYYYRIPVRPIYKSYPVYGPGHEPATANPAHRGRT